MFNFIPFVDIVYKEVIDNLVIFDFIIINQNYSTLTIHSVAFEYILYVENLSTVNIDLCVFEIRKELSK